MANPTPVLDLATLTDRPIVRIDGAAYRLRASDDFSILEFHQHAQEVPRFAALMNQETLTDADGAELALLLGRYTRRVLEAPEDVQARLSDGQRLTVVTLFSKLLGLGRLMPGAPTRATTTAPTRTPPTTGAAISPDSPGSTEATH